MMNTALSTLPSLLVSTLREPGIWEDTALTALASNVCSRNARSVDELGS
jgi:hypothetical protein